MLCALVFALLLSCANAMAVKINNATPESGSGAEITDQNDKSFKVTYDGQKDKEYVVMVVSKDGVGEGDVPTKESISNNQNGVVVYMDQVESNSEGKVEFVVRPNLENADTGDTYRVYMSSNEASGNTMKLLGSFTLEDVLELIGDVNGDAKVNSSDITALVNLIISGRDLTENQKVAADSNKDGVVNSSDITALVNLVIKG